MKTCTQHADCHDARPLHPCPTCGKLTHNVTCGRSECQQAAYLANRERIEAARLARRRSRR